MKYFKLKHSIGKDTKVHPQAKTINQLGHIDMANSMSKVSFDPSFKPIVESIPLVPNAGITDLLSVVRIRSPYALVVSEKFIQTINHFKVQDNSLFPVTILQKTKKVGTYYIFKFNGSIGKYLNLTKSSFYQYDHKTRTRVENVDLSDVDPEDLMLDWHKYSDLTTTTLHANFLKLDPKFDFDFFSTSKLFGRPIVSERLKTKMEDEGINGVRYEEVPIFKEM